MGEISSRRNGTEKVVMRAQTYGVIENDASCFELFGK